MARSRYLFKLWLARIGSVGGVPHPTSADGIDICKVPSPGEPNAPVPVCWGNNPQNAARWCTRVSGHCPRLLVEIIRAVGSQMGRGEQGRALAFSARTYEIIKGELLTGAGASSLTMTAQQCMQKISRTMSTYSGSNADKDGKEYFRRFWKSR